MKPKAPKKKDTKPTAKSGRVKEVLSCEAHNKRFMNIFYKMCINEIKDKLIKD